MPDDPLWQFYERARNRIRECEPITFIPHVIAALADVQERGLEIMHRYQPWNILLALKWVFQEASPISLVQRPATLNDLHYILSAIRDMGGNVRMPNEYAHVTLFMRHLAFQQFWLQSGPSSDTLARQELLFSNLAENHTFISQISHIIILWY
jgi:hypothetical protein